MTGGAVFTNLLTKFGKWIKRTPWLKQNGREGEATDNGCYQAVNADKAGVICYGHRGPQWREHCIDMRANAVRRTILSLRAYATPTRGTVAPSGVVLRMP
jgi:hypothetical protein